MTVKVRVQNFQSIEDAEVEISGFTVVTGQNNGGKSALQRAIRGVFQNTKGSSFIRHGKAKSMVTVNLDDDHMVYWEKGLKSKPTYIVDNSNPIHPGQAVPDEVSDLGVRGIQAGNREIWPQIAPQFTGQIFLLDQPGSVLAEAVADVDRVSQLNQALRLSESDRRAANSELKIRRTDKEQLEKDLKRFEGMDEVIETVETLEQAALMIDRIEKALEGVQELYSRYTDAFGDVERLKGIEEVVVPEDSKLDSLKDVLETLADIGILHSRYVDASDEVSRLEGVDKVKVPSDKKLEDLQDLANNIIETQALHNRFTKASGVVSKLEDVETITLDDGDISKIDRIVTAINMAQELFVQHTTVVTTITQLEAEIIVAEKESAEAQAAVVEYLKELGQCPVCDSTISD